MEGGQPAKLYNLGPSLGYLLAVSPQSDQKGSSVLNFFASFSSHTLVAGAVAGKGRVTGCLDRSGSMGAWVEYARRAIQAALLQLGYTEEDEISLITFDSHSERVMVDGRDPTVGELTTRLGHVRSRGCTSMAGAIPLLGDVLRSHPNSAHNILVISDGVIDDQSRTVQIATEMVNSLGPREAPVTATLLRLQTSNSGEPDTRALACVGSFCNQSKAAVTDVDVSNSRQEELGILNLTEAIVTGFRDAPTGTFVELVAEEPLFRRLPTAEPMSTVRIGCNGGTTYLLIREPVETVSLGGQQVPVQLMGPPQDEATVAPFLEFLGQQLKMWQLMGTRQSDIRIIVDWLGQLQTALETLLSQAVENVDLSTIGRARAVRKAIQKRTGSILHRIRNLGNDDMVGKLDAQQQADYLRGIQNTRTGRGLARRVQRGDNDLDFGGQAQTAVRLLAAQPEPEEDDNAPRSFYSLSTAAESLAAARELTDVADNVTIGDVLQCVGFVGVPFEAFVGDFPDPFALRIKTIYEGQFLAESDVWLVRAQSGQHNAVLQCPGRGDAVISGVIAIRGADPEAYKRYTTGEVRRLMEMQASSQIRHAVAPVPYDAVALSAAGAWHLIQKLGFERQLNTIQWETLRSLIDNIQFLIGPVYKEAPFRELYDSMVQNADVRPWLSGDRDVSGVLRPITVLLRFFDAPEDANATVAWIPHVLRALFYLDCYQAAKRNFRKEDASPQARDNVLRLMLGINMEAHQTPLRPLFEAEPENPEHYDAVVVDQLVVPQFFPQGGGLIGLEAVLRNRVATMVPIAVFGVHPNTLRAVAAVQALKCPNQSDRINTDDRTSLLPDPTTEEEALTYLRSVVRSYYAEDYAQRAAAKKREEDRITLERAIDALVACTDYAEFRRLLLTSPIVNRQHEGYSMLIDRIMQLTPQNRDARFIFESMTLLVTGRETHQPEEGVWANGNFYTGNWLPIANFIQLFEGGQDRMALLRKLRKQYGIYRYRGGEDHKPNQHGHGNGFISYWAMGYKDLYDMQQSVAEEDFRRYLQEHCIAKGCCMPNEPQRKDFGL